MIAIYLLSINGVWGETSGHLLCGVVSMIAMALSAVERTRLRSLPPVLCALIPNCAWSLALESPNRECGIYGSNVAGIAYLWALLLAPAVVLTSLCFERFNALLDAARV